VAVHTGSHGQAVLLGRALPTRLPPLPCRARTSCPRAPAACRRTRGPWQCPHHDGLGFETALNHALLCGTPLAKRGEQSHTPQLCEV
jgi:hypothetical protein